MFIIKVTLHVAHKVRKPTRMLNRFICYTLAISTDRIPLDFLLLNDYPGFTIQLTFFFAILLKLVLH